MPFVVMRCAESCEEARRSSRYLVLTIHAATETGDSRL